MAQVENSGFEPGLNILSVSALDVSILVMSDCPKAQSLQQLVGLHDVHITSQIKNPFSKQTSVIHIESHPAYRMGSFYAYKCKHFRNTRHTVTFGIPP
jgi:hypothetical protein